MKVSEKKVMFSAQVPESLKSLQIEFAAHIRNPEKHSAPKAIESRRMNIYKRLFYSNISSLLAGSFPITHEILDDQEWSDLVRSFYQAQNNHTPHFPEISREFVLFLQNNYASDKHPYLAEFAHYEWVELAADIDLRELNKNPDLSSQQLFEGVVDVSPLVRLHVYHYPVHQISTDFIPNEKSPEPFFFAVYRDSDDEVKFLQLNQVSAYLLETLQNNTALSSAEVLKSLAKQMQADDVEAIVNFGRDVIWDWYQKDMIRGLRQS